MPLLRLNDPFPGRRCRRLRCPDLVSPKAWSQGTASTRRRPARDAHDHYGDRPDSGRRAPAAAAVDAVAPGSARMIVTSRTTRAAPNATDPFWSGNRWTAPATVTPVRGRGRRWRGRRPPRSVEESKTGIMLTTIIATDHPTATTPPTARRTDRAVLRVPQCRTKPLSEGPSEPPEGLPTALDRQVGAHYDAQQQQAEVQCRGAPVCTGARPRPSGIGDCRSRKCLAVPLVRHSIGATPSST